MTEIFIQKKQNNSKRWLRSFLPFSSAREGFAALLRALNVKPDDKVLLPCYVGWSPREGSGIIDPVQAVGATPVFYRVDGKLTTDLEDFSKMVARWRPATVLVVHYFGRPDPGLTEMARIATENNVPFIEDEAHAMFSDLVAEVCGRSGVASLVSLHKMLPFSSGGALVVNPTQPSTLTEKIERDPAVLKVGDQWWNYDLINIARTRCDNSKILDQQLQTLEGLIEPLWPHRDDRLILHTYPIVLKRKDRNEVYQLMNNAGYGVVSLYHTLAKEVPSLAKYAECRNLSRTILNLPVHQDVDPHRLVELVAYLKKVLE